MAALWREYGVPGSVVHHGIARDTLRGFAEAGGPMDLLLAGTMTDGGIDGLNLTPQAAGTAATFVLSDMVRHFWVESAFQAVDDYMTFCSDIGPNGGAAANVLLASSITGAASVEAPAMRAENRARRAFILSCLRRVAPALWGMDIEGFGSMQSASLEHLEQYLLVAWQAPGPRHLLMKDLSAAEQRHLVNLVRSIDEQASPPLVPVVSLTQPTAQDGVTPKRHPWLVDLHALARARAWDARRHWEMATEHAARARALRRTRTGSAFALDSAEDDAAETAAFDEDLQQCDVSDEDNEEVRRALEARADALRQARACVAEVSGADRAIEALEDFDDPPSLAMVRLPWLTPPTSTGSSASGPETPQGHTSAEGGGVSSAGAKHWGSLTLAAPGRLSVLTELTVSRGVHCSCPLEVGVVLGLRGPVTPRALEAPLIAALDDVTDLDQLPVSRKAAAGGPLPAVHCVHRLDEATVAEFEREEEDTCGVFPIAWFHFHVTVDSARRKAVEQPTWTETGSFTCRLRQPRSTGSVIVKVR